MSFELKRGTWGPNSPLFFSYFKDFVLITNIRFTYWALSGVKFSINYYDLRGYIVFSPRLGIWNVSLFFFSLSFIFSPFCLFFFSFPFFLFFFFIFFILSLSLGGPFSCGAPGHCPSMPPSRYATARACYRKSSPTSKTKRSPWKSEGEFFFFWIVPFMVCCLYVWMVNTRAVTYTSAVDKWFAMYPLFSLWFWFIYSYFFAFIVTIQLTLLLGYQLWG